MARWISPALTQSTSAAVAPHEVEDREIRARLLGEADDVERREIGEPLGDFRGVVDVSRRTEPAGKLNDILPGNICEYCWKWGKLGHGDPSKAFPNKRNTEERNLR